MVTPVELWFTTLFRLSIPWSFYAIQIKDRSDRFGSGRFARRLR
jgi:hypothetical protein